MAPERILPEVPLAGSPARGLGRVVLDVQEGPAIVERLDGAGISGIAGVHALSASVEIARRVCVTPCVLDIEPGPHELRFTLVADDERTSTDFVDVDDRVAAYRHAIGRHSNRAWKGLVGWPALVAGTIADVVLAGAIARGNFEATSGNVTGITVGVGIAVGFTVLGGWLVSGAVIEDQPGHGVHWQL